jgi:transcription initiation factor TFIIH subunit 2
MSGVSSGEIGSVYKWEQSSKRIWKSVNDAELDTATHVEANDLEVERMRSHRAKLNRVTESIRRGIIRYMVVALDCSSASSEMDVAYRPYMSRLDATKTLVGKFIADYYDQNPISSLSMIITRDRIAQRLTDLSANSRNHMNKLKEFIKMEGAASLQNTIILAMAILKHIPDYGQKEVLIVYSSLSSCDPGDIFEVGYFCSFSFKLSIDFYCFNNTIEDY